MLPRFGYPGLGNDCNNLKGCKLTKIITSPCKAWPGEIELFDPLSFPMVGEWEEAVYQARGKNAIASIQVALLPGILPCVKEWRLENFPAHPTLATFPAKPHQDRMALLGLLVNTITELYQDASELPND